MSECVCVCVCGGGGGRAEGRLTDGLSAGCAGQTNTVCVCVSARACLRVHKIHAHAHILLRPRQALQLEDFVGTFTNSCCTCSYGVHELVLSCSAIDQDMWVWQHCFLSDSTGSVKCWNEE